MMICKIVKSFTFINNQQVFTDFINIYFIKHQKKKEKVSRYCNGFATGAKPKRGLTSGRRPVQISGEIDALCSMIRRHSGLPHCTCHYKGSYNVK